MIGYCGRLTIAVRAGVVEHGVPEGGVELRLALGVAAVAWGGGAGPSGPACPAGCGAADGPTSPGSPSGLSALGPWLAVRQATWTPLRSNCTSSRPRPSSATCATGTVAGPVWGSCGLAAPGPTVRGRLADSHGARSARR